MSNQVIIEKIQKLFALSQSPNENEAKAAWAKAQKMLLEHNLSEAQVLFDNNVKEEFIVKEMPYDKNLKRVENYKKTLLSTIARTNFCRVLFISGTNRCRIFGAEKDIQIVMFMYIMILNQIETLADESFATYEYRSIVHGSKYKTSYKLGIVSELGRILNQANHEVEMEQQQFAIVLADKKKKVEIFYNANSGSVRNLPGSKISSNDAYYRGRNDAGKVNIRKGITG